MLNLQLKKIVFAPFLKKTYPRNLHYVQGQEPKPRLREYFYYINHEGMLFLDDARIKNFTSCFKEKKFLKFFFNRLKINDSERYKNEFPFVSPCGHEQNYVRCDDLPIVYTHILTDKNGEKKLSYAHADELLVVDFEPKNIFMSPKTGRVYHPAWEKVGSIGLLRSKLAIELSKYFEFEEGEKNPPTHFTWNDVRYKLDKEWVNKTISCNKL